MNYKEAYDRLGGKEVRKLRGTATTLETRDGGAIAVKYYDTDIVTFYPDGAVRFDNGGYKTASTKAKMSEWTYHRVYQEKHEWYITTDEGVVDYYNGITLKDGRVVCPSTHK